MLCIFQPREFTQLIMHIIEFPFIRFIQLWSNRFIHSHNFLIQVKNFIIFSFQNVCAHSHNFFQNIYFLILLFQLNLQVFYRDLSELPDFNIRLQKSFFQICHQIIYFPYFISEKLDLILFLLYCKILIIYLLVLQL